MSTSPEPLELQRPPRSDGSAAIQAVLDGSDAVDGDAHAWSTFLNRHSRLLLYVASRSARSYDERMNLYTHLVTELRRDGCRRLRGYRPTGGARFATWLVVVARRLCVDYQRARYGRPGDSADGNALRRRLEDFVYTELDPDQVVDDEVRSPEAEMCRSELLRHLADAVRRLEPRDRLILNLRFADGRTAREIAAALQLRSQWHVYRRIDAILKGLRQALDGKGIHDACP